MTTHRISYPVLGALVAALLLAACGSGGGTNVVQVPDFATKDLFDGSYGYFGVRATQGGPEKFTALWGSMSVTPTMVNETGDGNNTGVVGGGAGAIGGNHYYVHGDRRFGTQNTSNGLLNASGGISEDGDVGATVGIANGATPGFQMMVRRGTGLDASILTGEYFFASIGMGVAGTQTVSRWGRAMFDGAGTGTIEISGNVEGLVGGPGMTGFTYGVAANGSISWTFTGAQDMQGQCSPDGELVVLSGGIDPGDDPLLLVFVRVGSGFGDASIEGPWFLVGLSQEVGPSTYSAFTGALYVEPMGNTTVAGLVNVEGTTYAVPSDNATTTVAADGALMLSTPGGDVFHGGLSSSGRLAVLGGSATPGGDPGMFLLLR